MNNNDERVKPARHKRWPLLLAGVLLCLLGILLYVVTCGLITVLLIWGVYDQFSPFEAGIAAYRRSSDCVGCHSYHDRSICSASGEAATAIGCFR